MVMTQEKLRDGDTLRVHADRQLMELAKQLHDFDLLESRETTCGGMPAVFMRFLWTSHFGALEQSMTLVEVERKVTSFTTTAPVENASEARALFNEMLKSVHFAPEGEPVSLAPPMSSQAHANGDDLPIVPMPGFRGTRR